MKSGIELIADERQEQLNKHGRGLATDVKDNNKGQLAFAATTLSSQYNGGGDKLPEKHRIAHTERWIPIGWDETIWKKMVNKPYKERLIIAGALIAAEIDRLQNT